MNFNGQLRQEHLRRLYEENQRREWQQFAQAHHMRQHVPPPHAGPQFDLVRRPDGTWGLPK